MVYNVGNDDFKIIEILRQNACIPSGKIASMIESDEEGVNKKIEKLCNSGVIRKFTAIIDPCIFNKRRAAYVFVEAEEMYGKVLKTMSNIHGVEGIYAVYGDVDFIIKLYAENEFGVNDFVENTLFKEYGLYVKNTATHLITHHFTEWGFNFQNTVSERMQMFSGLKLSDLDLKILNELQQDCRQKYEDIAEKTEEEIKRVKDRINFLEKNKVIRGYTILVDHKELNIAKALIALNLEKKLFNSAIDYILSSEFEGNLFTCFSGLGFMYADVWCHFEVQNIYELDAITDLLRSNIPGVRSTKTYIIAKIVKEDTTPIQE